MVTKPGMPREDPLAEVTFTVNLNGKGGGKDMDESELRLMPELE